MTLDPVLSPSLESGRCPHLAVLLRTQAELYPVLASFYALGAKRRGWLVHRSLPGEAVLDRERLEAAGLDIGSLEDNDQLAIVEFDPNEEPECSPRPWKDALERSLESGFKALWYSRFAIGPDDDEFRDVLPFERAWDRSFAGQPVVTLCPYVLGSLDGASTLERLRGVSQLHDGVLVAGDDGLTMVARPSEHHATSTPAGGMG